MAIVLPSFVNPSAAILAASIAIPALLALYFLKLRRREMEVSSTYLWKKAIQDLQVNAPFQRLRRNLLLLLQLLILLCLIFALSQPLINRNKSLGKLSVILIDRSASMQSTDGKGGITRLEDAKQKARDMVSSLPKDGAAMVMAFDEGAEVVQSFTSDPVMLRNAIDQIQPSQLGTRVKTALGLVEARSMAFISDQNRPNEAAGDLWVFSDGRIEDINRVSLKTAALKGYISSGSPDSVNVGIVALSAKRNYERPSEVQIFARLENFSPKVVQASVQLSVDGRIPTGGVRRGIKLGPNRWTDEQRQEAEQSEKDLSGGGVEFNLDISRGALVKIEVKDVEADVFAHDDVAQIIVPPPKTLNVLLVRNKDNPALEKFLLAADFKNAGRKTGDEYEAEMKKDDGAALMKNFDVILFDQVQPSKIPAAGNFIYFGVVPPNSPVKFAVDEAGVEVVNQNQTATYIKDDHPLMKGVNLWRRVFCKWTYKLKLPIEAERIVESDDGVLVAMYREGRHTHVMLPFDVMDSNWPLVKSFPRFLDNCMQYLALGSDMDIRQSYAPGSAVRIPRYALSGVKKVKVSGPPGFDPVETPVEGTGDFALPIFPRVGVYSVSPEIPSYEKYAVNLLSPAESDISPREQLSMTGVEGGGVKSIGGKSRENLWWWLVAAGAIPLCLIEWWVYTRRVHL